VERAGGGTTLCLIPAKFNKKLWFKRGGFLLIEEAPEAAADAASRVTGTILNVLYEEQIRQLKRTPGAWPPEFEAAAAAPPAAAADGDVYAGLPAYSDDSGSEEGGSGGGEEAAARPDAGAASASGGGGADAAAAGLAAARIADADDGGSESGGSSSGGDDGRPPLERIANRRVIHHDYSSDSDEDG